MPKTRTITDPAKRDVTHAELRALVDHMATLIAALEVRVSECERSLPVDPEVRETADAFVAANNRPGLALVAHDSTGTDETAEPV